jgi:SAM-dependent methyltransferase
LPPLVGNVALEDGGGDGGHIPDFGRRFKRVVFLDASLANAVFARRLVDQSGLADRVICVRADATELPFKDGVFDFVHCVGVIEHVADRQALVNEGVRVANTNGYLVIGSPNRYPITREPHFQLPLFGLFPKPLRSRLIYRTRGVTSEEGTDPLSLRDLRHTLTEAGAPSAEIFFVPRSLGKTARQTPARRIIVSALSSPLGGVLDGLINGVLLPVAPSHLAIVSGGDHLNPSGMHVFGDQELGEEKLG